MIRLLRQSWIWLKTFLWPSPLYSWKTIIYMSLFSWLMALLSRHLGASGLTVGIMGTLGWVLLALGVGWFLEANRIKPLGLSIAPWVAGGILCLFLSASWGDRAPHEFARQCDSPLQELP